MKYIDRLITLYQTEKPEVTSENIAAALAVVKKLKENKQDKRIEINEEELYLSAERLVRTWEIENPFADKKYFWICIWPLTRALCGKIFCIV